jgi:hypothetical protein
LTYGTTEYGRALALNARGTTATNAHPTVQAIVVAFALDASVGRHALPGAFGAARLSAHGIVRILDTLAVSAAIDGALDTVVALGILAALLGTALPVAAQKAIIVAGRVGAGAIDATALLARVAAVAVRMPRALSGLDALAFLRVAQRGSLAAVRKLATATETLVLRAGNTVIAIGRAVTLGASPGSRFFEALSAIAAVDLPRIARTGVARVDRAR